MQSFDMFKLDFSLCLSFQLYIETLRVKVWLGSRHKNHLVRIRKRSSSGLKYVISSQQTSVQFYYMYVICVVKLLIKGM